MNEKGMTGSCDEQSSNLYPMIFGVSCALFSSKHSLNWAKLTHEVVHGGATLMSLLLWRVEREEQVKSEKCELLNKVKNAETEIQELKKRRVEDAKANEKVVSIFAAHEQRWLTERKKLTRQIQLLLNDLQLINTKRQELDSELSKMREIIQKYEKMNQELRETLKREAQEHSKEIWKHKSAFIELVSTQRQLEAEMGRAVRQIEAEKQEFDAVLEQKEEYVLMTQNLSMELIKTRKDLVQKDKILSAMLIKQVKMSKETEESKVGYSLRNMLSRSRLHKSKLVPPVAGTPPHTGSQPTNQQSELKEKEEDIKNMSSLMTWKMDLQALGVFYKIKRLKQQLLMFERLNGNQENDYYSLMSLVNKQVSRYQSLQDKANDICKRIHESGSSIAGKSKDETKKLEHFLEETFQLQRYIVATGQKLIEIQSKIASCFVSDEINLNLNLNLNLNSKGGFDMKKFGDCLQTLFREVQRGLEVEISRIIGDLEGPLARDGMIHPRN